MCMSTHARTASLPGVAMTTWGRLDRALDCACMSTPPMMTCSFRLMPAPRALNCSSAWMASSLTIDA
eukprot:scaffold139126_cov19-Tisochrysis_lutea.AAC.1